MYQQQSSGQLLAEGLKLLNNSNPAKAATLIRQAADQGNAAAQNRLGKMYEDGEGMIKNNKFAAEWYQKAADQGYALAQYNLGTLYQFGQGVAKNDAKAAEWYQKAAEKGEIEAQLKLAIMYQNGRGVLQDYAKAIEWLQKAANAGSTSAKDRLPALRAKARSSNNNNNKPLTSNQLYEEGKKYEETDQVKALIYIEQAANQGHLKAKEYLRHPSVQAFLASMYYTGEGVEKNDAKAAEWYQKAANQGSEDARKMLTALQQNNTTTSLPPQTPSPVVNPPPVAKTTAPDTKKAGVMQQIRTALGQEAIGLTDAFLINAIEAMANQGDPNSQQLMGVLCKLDQNDSKAAEWYQKAANQGNKEAKKALAALQKDTNVTTSSASSSSSIGNTPKAASSTASSSSSLPLKVTPPGNALNETPMAQGNIWVEKKSLNEKDLKKLAEKIKTGREQGGSIQFYKCSLDKRGFKWLIAACNEKPEIQKLDIWPNSLDDEGLIALAEALKTNTTIRKLNLCSNDKIGDKGIQHLSECLKQNNTLQDINLNGELKENFLTFSRGGKITDAGAGYLANALKVNTSLEVLRISNHHIGELGIQYLAESLEVNTSLKLIDLSSNDFSPRAAKAIAKALRTNQTLQAMNIGSENSKGKFGAAGYIEICQALASNTSLLYFNMGDITCSFQQNSEINLQAPKFKDILKSNKTLMHLGWRLDQDLPTENRKRRDSFLTAAERGDLEKVKQFLAEGVSVNTSDTYDRGGEDISTYDTGYKPNGNTALHIAITFNQPAVAKYLLDRGANPFLKNVEGKTAFDLLKSRNFPELAKQMEALTGKAPIASVMPAVTSTPAYVPAEPKPAAPKVPATSSAFPAAASAPASMPTPVTPAWKATAPVAKAPASFPLPSSKVTTPPITNSPSHSRIDATGNVTVSVAIPSADLTFGRELGRGAFGVVYQGTWHDSPAAIKTLLLHDMKQEVLDNFIQEASVMVALKHPNIIQLSGITLDRTPYCMVMEFMENGSLYSYLHSARPLDFPLQVQIAMDIARGLSYLHGKLILHRDLKSLNVLLNGQLRAKLADFGLSKVRHQTMSQTAGKMVGTPQWMAPELFDTEDETSKGNEKSDMYSYGMVLWELLARRDPFAGTHDPIQIAMRVLQGKRETIPTEAHPTFKQLIDACWKKAADKRPSAQDALEQLQPLQPQTGSTSAASASHGDYADNLASGQPASTSTSSRIQSYAPNLASGQPVASTRQASAGFFQPPPPPPLGSYTDNLASGPRSTLPRPGKK